MVELNKKDYVIIFLILFMITLFYASFVLSRDNFITGYVVKEQAFETSEIEKELVDKGDVRIIVELKEDTEIPAITGFIVREAGFGLTDKEFKKKYEFKAFNGFSAEVTREGFEKLKNNPRVKNIFLDRKFKITLSDSVPLINADYVWDLNFSGTNITGEGSVCVLDTGIDYTHVDLGSCFGSDCKVIDGYDFVNNDNDPMDDNNHGTHVAGIVAGNGSIRGVAPNARLIALKVCDSSGNTCYVSDVTEAIEWCVSNQSRYDIKVITMSFGGGSYSSECDDVSGFESLVGAINSAVAVNMSIFGASGNDGSVNGIVAPACISNVISIGATDKSDNIAGFSNRNSLLDLMAPGSSIVSTTFNNGSTTKSGTSMAAPHAAGAAVLLYQYVKELNGTILNSNGVKYALKNGKDIYDLSSNLTFPRIDLYQAVLAFDVTRPSIYFVDPSPDNDSYVGSWIYINVTSNEDLNFSILEFDNINKTMNGANKNFYFNQTNLSYVHDFRIFANDSAGNWNSTELRKVYLENNNPLISLKNPLNNTSLEDKEVVFSFNITDDLTNVSSCKLLLNDTSISLNGVNNTEINYTIKLTDGFYSLNLECVDGTIKSSNVTSLFYVNGSAIISNGLPNGTFYDGNVVLTIKTDEDAVCDGRLNVNFLNFTFLGIELMHNYTVNLDFSSYNTYAVCNDTSGKTSDYNWSFIIEGTTTTTTTIPASSGSSSGGGGGDTEIPIATTTTIPLETTTTTTIPAVTTTTIEQEVETFEVLEEDNNQDSGLVGLVGGVIRDLGEKPIIAVSITLVVIISGSFMLYRRFIR